MIASLAGAVLGLLEGLWRLSQAPPRSAGEASLLLGWAAVAYAVPAFALGGIGVGVARLGRRVGARGLGIPPALLALGFWLVVGATSRLSASGRLTFYLVELPASLALSVGLCLLLAWRWPAVLDRVLTWLILTGLTISATVGLLAVTYWPATRTAAVGGSPEARNVLLITIDTLRADHLGSYGYAKGRTPTLDRLAEGGVVFEEAHAQAPFTCPSHASILTGRDPFEHGAIDNSGTPVRADVATLPEILGPRGFETAAFVSATPVSDRVCGLGRGFDSYGEDFSPWRWLPQSTLEIGAIRLLQPVARRLGKDLGRYERPAGETTDAVLRWLERPRNGPFFVWVHYFDPHLPFTPPAPYREMFDPDYTGAMDGRWYSAGSPAREKIASTAADLRHMIALYDGEVAFVDAQLDRLLAALSRLDLAQSTLVIVTSDHGESHGEHDRYFARDLYRPSLHVPLILSFPPGEAEPRRVSQQVRLIDVAPTVLDYVGIAGASPGGLTLLPLARGGSGTSSRPVYALFPRGQLKSTTTDMFALQDDGYKLLWRSAWWYADGVRVPPREELYDVQADPFETENVIAEGPPVLPDLRQRLGHWSAGGTGDREEPTEEVLQMLKRLGYVQ